MSRASFAMIAWVALGAGACVIVSTHTTSTPRDRSELLRDSAELVVVPGYRDLSGEARELRAAVDALCASPDEETLASAQGAFRATSHAWERTLPWGFGPLADQRLEGEIEFWPTRATSIETNLASGATIDEAWVAGLGATGKGLPALEYLLFARDAAPTDVLGDARRCAYAASIAAYLETTTARLERAWTDGYVEQLATAGRGSTAWRSQLDALSAMLTQMISSVQRIKTTKLGAPLGLESGGTAQPDAVELPYASTSVDAMVAMLEGLRALWRVEGGTGLDAAVRERDAALADRVVLEIDAAVAALRAIPEPFAEYVERAQRPEADAAVAALRGLERTLASDVSSTLAISVMFTDNDGD